MTDVVVTVGLDLAKNVFQVDGVDGAGGISVRRKLRRAEVLQFFSALRPCLAGMEACASANYRTREICRLGLAVRMMPTAWVKPAGEG